MWILSGNSHAGYVAKSCLMKIKDAASIAAVTSCLQDGIGDARQVAGNPLPQLVGKCDAASIAAVISCLNRMVQKTEKFCADRVQKKKLQSRVPEVIQYSTAPSALISILDEVESWPRAVSVTVEASLVR